MNLPDKPSYNDPAAPAEGSRLQNGACLTFLILCAFALFYPFVHAPGLATDVYSFLRESYEGVMPWGYLESHRPFRTITWNTACLLGGYSKNGVHAFALGLQLICSLLVYGVVRKLWPGNPAMALAAGVLRLTWTTGILAGTNDVIIEGLMPETLFMGAALLLIHLESRERSGLLLWLGRFSVPALIYLAMGMYEQVWGNIACFPLVLLISGVWSLRRKRQVIGLVFWYAGMGLYLISYFGYFDHFGKPSTPLNLWEPFGEIWLSMTRVLTVDTVVNLSKATWRMLHSEDLWIPLGLSGAFGLLFWYSSKKMKKPRVSLGTGVRFLAAALFWFLFGYLHMVIGLASNYGNVAIWGSRFVHGNSYASIFLIGVLIWLGLHRVKMGARLGFTLIITLLLLANASLIVDGWDTWGVRGNHIQSLHRQMSRELPALRPGAFIVIDAQGLVPDNETDKHKEDIIHTFCLRNLYGNDNLYVYFNLSCCPISADSEGISVDYGLVYPHDAERLPDYIGIGANGRYMHPQLVSELNRGRAAVERIRIKRSDIVWLKYKKGKFVLQKDKSNLSLIKWPPDPLHKRMLDIQDKDFQFPD